jgi:NADH-quinone oxidoreductase subunit N
MWSPDVYQGSPSPVTGFMAAVVKIGAFAALLRVFVSSLGIVRTDWQPIIWGLAILSLVIGAVLALMQRDVKRMMAYSSINHAGFILLGVGAATTRGVSSSLYYVFTYLFLTIGSFAVITVMARPGDTGHQISDYRGLAKRQPVLALCFAALLLGQAGVPFTTGFLAKFGVVGAAEDVHAYTVAAIAMASAAIAAFFYLRVAVAMYSPVGLIADPWPVDDAAPAGVEGPDGDTGQVGDPAPARVGDEAADTAFAEVSTLRILTDDPPDESVEERGRVSVPWMTSLVIGITVAFTVVFGIVPAPILDFAHQATLLFT